MNGFPQNGPPAGRIGDVQSIVTRLEQVIAAETAALQRHEDLDLADTAARKSRMLLELVRSMRSIEDSTSDPAISDQLSRLQDALAENNRVLKLHIGAVQELVNDLSAAELEAESDGTYSATPYHLVRN